ncbi:hypothetical protein [Amycolatopsis decaplanina]|uniref:hypothetical protein n=1 Tax=Amycolatopsis decaplanina TaxID=208441 RepID=UPI0003490D39|nr:hypothetical protein [Amycolatopsis decaplanina]
MKRLFSAAMAIAALGFAAACGGGSTPRDTAPADLTTDSGATTTETAPTASSESASPSESAPGTTSGHPGESRPPVIPGSPIRYNSDLLNAEPATAKNAIEQNLADLCLSPRRCGVSVVIAGKGDCIRAIGPNPVYPGKTITIQTRACETETTGESSAPPKPESAKPSETTSG